MYRVNGVAVGEQKIRVLMMTYRGPDATVTVLPDDSVRADFTIRQIWFDRVFPKPSSRTSTCPEHSVRMRWALVATSSGLLVVNPDDERAFPNAWPLIDQEMGPGALKVAWGQSCLKCVDGWNEKHSDHRWSRLPHSSPVTWDRYRIDGVVDFKAPRGLTDSVAVDSCNAGGRWKGRNLLVEIRRVPPWNNRPKGNYNVWDLIGDCKAAICVVEEEGTSHVTASLASTTNSIDDMEISITASGRDAIQTARTILGTMRFPEPGGVHH